jgi:hypothetical protein
MLQFQTNERTTLSLNECYAKDVTTFSSSLYLGSWNVRLRFPGNGTSQPLGLKIANLNYYCFMSLFH